jgi:nucleolar protein 14
MPPSQLKRLKSSLREQGIVGPQKSKKQKKNQKTSADQHARKAAALASIREVANPFDFKHLARPKKFEYATNKPQDGGNVLGRPGVTKSQGEEARRKTLLPEMNRRNKVGGIVDRRIGESDPSMSLDDRMMARFEREQQRKRGGNVFDLEEADDMVELTHGGQALEFDDEEVKDDIKDDYDAASVSGSSEDGDDFLRKKRRRDDEDGMDGEADETRPDEPERKKSKKEVMEEVIAKSKQYKYERQKQKDDDYDLIEGLDKDLPDILAALRGHITKKEEPPAPAPAREAANNSFGMNPERAALLAGKSREAADKEYDARVRQLLHDQRAKPTERTKTEEEKAKEDAERLRELEGKRTRRMQGEEESESEDEKQKGVDEDEDADDAESEHDDAAEFGFAGPSVPGSRPEGVEDEDDFEVDDDLIATDSEAGASEESGDESELDDTMAMDDDDEFLRDVLPETKKTKPAVNGVFTGAGAGSAKLAYTYPCPRSHDELLEVFKDVSPNDKPTVVQRIRALYHAGLAEDNKNKLTDFACALVDHISYLSNEVPATPLAVIETLIRHIHSMSRTYPNPIATRFRHHLRQLQVSNDPTPGDLTILTALGSIYPTSDHFHRVVTPAITLMARWSGLTTPTSVKDIATGAYIGALCIQYQRLSKRYVPEIIRYTILCLKSTHITPPLITAHAKNTLGLADLWAGTPAFIEIFTPLLTPLSTLNQTNTVQRLKILLQNARLHRRPQELHHHKPLPIKTSIPKFEEGFDPNKHYDPDRERADATRLQKEYKREKKGALRELRKDANFITREKLRDTKEKDKAYSEKYRRLVAEIQSEGGRDKNEYEKEKRARRRKA